MATAGDGESGERQVYGDIVPENELQEAQIRAIAQNGFQSLQKTTEAMQNNAAELGRWILASLLAINLGSAIAVISLSEKVTGSIGSSLVAFAVGAALAIATGINGLITTLLVSPHLGEATEMLMIDAMEGTLHAPTREKLAAIRPIIKRQVIVSALIATLSLGAFAVGVGLSLT